MSQPPSVPPSTRLPGLGTPMQRAGGGPSWNYPVNPFELQKQLEGGIAHHKAGRGEEAEKVYRAVLAKVPNQPDALNLLGVLAMEGGNHEAAFDLLTRAVDARPKDPAILNNFGNALSLVRRFEDAIEHLERALAIKPDMTDAWLNLGRTYNFSGHNERALVCFNRLLKLKPDSQAARSGVSRAQLGLGDTKAAEATARELIATAPAASPGYVNLSNVRKFKPEDPEIARVEELIASKDTSARELRGLYFAAAKMCDDVGRYDDAFRYYDMANKAAGGAYDAKGLEQNYAELKKTFTRKFFDEHASSWGSDSERPVFIVGMPRSGTTLTETIIGAHPQVFAAGELETVKRCERQMSDLVFKDEGPQKNPRNISWVGVEILANRYLDVIDVKAKNASAIRVTDKMPHNFQAVGFIALMFPKARIIHTRRSPFDTCLSIWQQNFNEAHTYGRNLTDLGHHYAHYLHLMEHWRQALPGRMLEIDYEDLVENQEEVSRRLVDFVGLPWDDACLRPHELQRTVLTASVWQVRQPVYKRSAGRWKNYEQHLAPLRESLLAAGAKI